MPVKTVDEIVRNQQRWIGNFALFLMSVGALIFLGTTDQTIRNAYLNQLTTVAVLLSIGIITFLISRSRLTAHHKSHFLSVMLLSIPFASISMLPYASVTVWASFYF